MSESAATILLHGNVVDREAMVRFKRAYEAAVTAGSHQYMFDGQMVLVSYAKYVVEYAETQMGAL